MHDHDDRERFDEQRYETFAALAQVLGSDQAEHRLGTYFGVLAADLRSWRNRYDFEHGDDSDAPSSDVEDEYQEFADMADVQGLDLITDLLRNRGASAARLATWRRRYGQERVDDDAQYELFTLMAKLMGGARVAVQHLHEFGYREARLESWRRRYERERGSDPQAC